jgi:hypothetical protein
MAMLTSLAGMADIETFALQTANDRPRGAARIRLEPFRP